MSIPIINRRNFLATSGVGAAAGAVISTLPVASARAAGANERIRIGMIGPGGRGFGAHVKSLTALRNSGAMSNWLPSQKSGLCSVRRRHSTSTKPTATIPRSTKTTGR